MAKIVADQELGKRIRSIIEHAPAIQPVIGANCDGRPEFSGYYLGHIGTVNEKTMIILRIPSRSYTLKGIRDNLTASVNIPTPEMMDEAIYLGGTNAGAEVPSRVEKAGVKVFYGKLGTAPMIEKSPVTWECSVAQVMDFGSHQMVVVRLEYVHVEQSCLPNGALSASKRTPGMAGGPDSIEFLNKVNPMYRYHIFPRSQPGKDIRSFLTIWTSPDGADKEMARIPWVAEPPVGNKSRFETSSTE